MSPDSRRCAEECRPKETALDEGFASRFGVRPRFGGGGEDDEEEEGDEGGLNEAMGASCATQSEQLERVE